jgi:hypothetical protein
MMKKANAQKSDRYEQYNARMSKFLQKVKLYESK